MDIREKNIAVVGLGLIGGSLIKAIRHLNPKTIKGIELSEDIIEKCISDGLLDNAFESNEDILKQADIVFICLYPERAIEYLSFNMPHFKSGVIITDVIGLKSNFMEQVGKIKREDVIFIGGHPMAGREGKGFDVSCESIFADANYLLVAEGLVDNDSIKILKNIIYGLGCKHVEILSAEEHDRIITYTSHMPHILSSTFMSCNDFSKTKHCIAGSFKDFTRVSDINPELWTELIMENRDFVLEEISKFKSKLTELEEHISKNKSQSVYDFLDYAKLKKRELSK